MSSLSTIGRAVAAAALGAALFAGHAQANPKAHFTDVLKPHGHQRGRSEEIVDAQACGATATTIQTIMPVFEKCMRRKGWVLDRYEADASQRPTSGSLQSYTDTRGDGIGHPRDDVALQSDSRACEARAGNDRSAGFRQCMAGRGWKFLFAQYAPARRVQPAPAQAQPNGWPGEVSWEENWAAHQSQEQDDYVRMLHE